MSTAHRYDPDTGAYLGPVHLRRDPEESEQQDRDVWLLPAGATHEVPPEAQAERWPRWTGSAWEMVEDHRGTDYWLDGSRHRMTALGPLPEGASRTPPALTVADARAARRAALRTAARAAIEAGITSDALGAPHDYPTTELDQQNLAGLSLAATVDGPGDPQWSCHYWCADGAGTWARRAHTAAQILTVSRTVMTHIQTQQARYEQRLQAVDAAETVSAIEAVVW